jgi:hypothetical protein
MGGVVSHGTFKLRFDDSDILIIADEGKNVRDFRI